jgi:uncharacterized membrane protein
MDPPDIIFSGVPLEPLHHNTLKSSADPNLSSFSGLVLKDLDIIIIITTTTTTTTHSMIVELAETLVLLQRPGYTALQALVSIKPSPKQPGPFTV